MEKMKFRTENDLMAHHSIREGKLHQELYSCAGINMLLFCYCSLCYFTDAGIPFSGLILIRFFFSLDNK